MYILLPNLITFQHLHQLTMFARRQQNHQRVLAITFPPEIPRPQFSPGTWKSDAWSGRNKHKLNMQQRCPLFSFLFFLVRRHHHRFMLNCSLSRLMRPGARSHLHTTVPIGNMFARNPRCFVAVADELQQRTNAFWWRFRSKGIRALSHSYARYESALFAVDGKQYVRCERCRFFGDAIIFIINAAAHVAEQMQFYVSLFVPMETHIAAKWYISFTEPFHLEFYSRHDTPHIRARTKCFRKANEPRMTNIYPVAIIIACLTPKTSRFSLYNEQTARKYDQMTMIRWILCHQTCNKIIRTESCQQSVDVFRRFMVRWNEGRRGVGAFHSSEEHQRLSFIRNWAMKVL